MYVAPESSVYTLRQSRQLAEMLDRFDPSALARINGELQAVATRGSSSRETDTQHLCSSVQPRSSALCAQLRVASVQPEAWDADIKPNVATHGLAVGRRFRFVIRPRRRQDKPGVECQVWSRAS